MIVPERVPCMESHVNQMAIALGVSSRVRVCRSSQKWNRRLVLGHCRRLKRGIGLICLGALNSCLQLVSCLRADSSEPKRTGLRCSGFTLAHEHVVVSPAHRLSRHAADFTFGARFFSHCLWVSENKARRRKASTTEWLQLGASVFVLLMFWIPYEWWQFSTIQVAGPRSRAANQLKTPASSGHRYLADALLKGGLKIDSPDTDRHTALATACSAGRKDMADYFISGSNEIGFRTRVQAVFGLCCENETRSATTRLLSPLKCQEKLPRNKQPAPYR